MSLHFRGRLDAASVAHLWPETVAALTGRDARVSRVVVDTSEVNYCDGAGMGLLLECQRLLHGSSTVLEMRGLQESTGRLLAMLPVDKFVHEEAPRQRVSAVTQIGMATIDALAEVKDSITFLGELMAEAARAIFHPMRLRWRDTLSTVEMAGVNAVPILLLLSFLFGLILAFQAVVSMRKFGVEIYVADLLSISLTRELGPLLAAIILTSRSASAFAAELGTMRVREEIDAMHTMGISPVRFLALPRVLGAAFVSPLLAIISTTVALVGGAFVIMGLGYPLAAYADHVIVASTSGDLLGGLFKSVVFGTLVAGVGCMQGLRAGSGPAAVGISTTRAVVSGLVLIIVSDGVFAILFTALGI
jgi:phospholipid/cholesterol/gamma-HCH transport system permease protein